MLIALHGTTEVVDAGHQLHLRDLQGIDHHGAEGPESLDGGVHDGPHLPVVVGVGVGALVLRLAQDTDTGADQAAPVEEVGVRLGYLPYRVGGDGVVAIVPGDGVENNGRVADGPGHGAHGVLRGVRRHHAVGAHQLERRPETHEVAHGRRTADGAARVLADGDQAPRIRSGCAWGRTRCG
jgi:hypothetical protein